MAERTSKPAQFAAFRASEDLLEAARQRARAEETTFSALVREALKAHLAEPHEEAPAA